MVGGHRLRAAVRRRGEPSDTLSEHAGQLEDLAVA